MKNKKLHVDFHLFISTPLVIISGIILHTTTHIENSCWLNYDIWTRIHLLSSIPMYILIYKHIAHHWNWYLKNLHSLKNNVITWCLSITFVLTCITGLITLFFPGPNSQIGILHMIIAIFSTIFVIIHIVKYFQVIKVYIKTRIKQR